MHISGKMLLNSAESILRDRRQDNGTDRGSETTIAQNAQNKSEALTQGVLESRILKLQSTLGTLQNSYTREQTRLTYLSEQPEKIDSSLQFDGTPLFPETGADLDTGKLKVRVDEQMVNLVRQLKAMQVEMENLYALNYKTQPIAGLDTRLIMNMNSMKSLDPGRVARLTKS